MWSRKCAKIRLTLINHAFAWPEVNKYHIVKNENTAIWDEKCIHESLENFIIIVFFRNSSSLPVVYMCSWSAEVWSWVILSLKFLESEKAKSCYVYLTTWEIFDMLTVSCEMSKHRQFKSSPNSVLVGSSPGPNMFSYVSSPKATSELLPLVGALVAQNWLGTYRAVLTGFILELIGEWP